MAKNNELNKESPIELVNWGYDFEWFWDDLYENFEWEESIIESVNNEKLDTDKIYELVSSEDYMWLQDYLDELDEEKKAQAQEYIQNNFPEFLEDEEWNTFEPMKWNTTKDKELLDNFEKKSHFDRNTIKNELWDALVESYKNAA